MSPPKRIAISLGLFLLVYGLLTVLWPGVGQAYAAFFHFVGNAMFGSVGSDGSVQFKAPSTNEGEWDTELLLFNRKTRASGDHKYINSQLTGYRPTVVEIAFILATPIPWSRKWRALLWGLLLVNVFVVFRLALQIIPEFCNANELAVFDVGPLGRRALFQMHAALVAAPAASYIVPVFIWALVAFRRGDWAALFAPKQPPDDAPPEG